MTNKTKVTDDAFEKWFEQMFTSEGVPLLDEESARRGYQSASQHYEREIARLDELNKTQAIYIDNHLAEISELKEGLATELKRVSSYKTLVNSLEGQVSHYSQKDYSLSEARLNGLEQSLNSEREMNEVLTNEITQLTAQVNQLREALTSIAVYNGGLQDSFSQIIEDTCNSALKSKK